LPWEPKDIRATVKRQAIVSVVEFRSKARRLKALNDIKIIVINYLQLMLGNADTKNGSREQEEAFIHHPEYYGIHEDENSIPTDGLAEFIIAKHRNGAVCDVNLRFLKEQVRFTDTLSDES